MVLNVTSSGITVKLSYKPNCSTSMLILSCKCWYGQSASFRIKLCLFLWCIILNLNSGKTNLIHRIIIRFSVWIAVVRMGAGGTRTGAWRTQRLACLSALAFRLLALWCVRSLEGPGRLVPVPFTSLAAKQSHTLVLTRVSLGSCCCVTVGTLLLGAGPLSGTGGSCWVLAMGASGSTASCKIWVVVIFF